MSPHSKRVWPISFRINRCRAFLYYEKEDKYRFCNRIFWPWTKDIIHDPEPDSAGELMHHECYHNYIKGIFKEDDTRNWKTYLWCEHEEET